MKITEGQAHDGRSAADMLGGLCKGQILLADRTYDSNALRQMMTAQGAWANIMPMSRRVKKPSFSRFLYRYRNLVERFFNKMKHFRAIAKRFEKHATNYLALVKLATTRIWLRSYEWRKPMILRILSVETAAGGLDAKARDHHPPRSRSTRSFARLSPPSPSAQLSADTELLDLGRRWQTTLVAKLAECLIDCDAMSPAGAAE